MKKRFKLAVLRSNDENVCPFGLPIPHGCKNAGSLVDKMAPINLLGETSSKEEIESLIKANRRLFMWIEPDDVGRCKYANSIIENKDITECGWEETSMRAALRGSPFYYKMFSGIGVDGLYSYPLGYYTENSIDKGIYNGMLYSLEGKEPNNIEKDSNEKKK